MIRPRPKRKNPRKTIPIEMTPQMFLTVDKKTTLFVNAPQDVWVRRKRMVSN